MQHHNFENNLPIPSTLSIVLLSIMTCSAIASKMHHADVNEWLTTITASCAIASYGFRVYKWNKKRRVIWDGSSDLANKKFGDRYGTDWEYLPNSLDITVSGRVIKLGDKI